MTCEGFKILRCQKKGQQKGVNTLRVQKPGDEMKPNGMRRDIHKKIKGENISI
jgi:hypothetical protein